MLTPEQKQAEGKMVEERQRHNIISKLMANYSGDIIKKWSDKGINDAQYYSTHTT